MTLYEDQGSNTMPLLKASEKLMSQPRMRESQRQCLGVPGGPKTLDRGFRVRGVGVSGLKGLGL